MEGVVSARALYLELAAHGADVHTGAVPDSMPPDEAGVLLGRVRVNRAGLREVLKDGHDPDIAAIRWEGGAS